MRLHASCAARPGPDGPHAVLLLGPSGCGKSDFLLRLLHRGFLLLADDQVLVEDGQASAPARLAGILEVRGLGLFRLPYIASAPLKLVVQLGPQLVRLPEPARHAELDLPLVTIDPATPSAPERLILALDAATGLCQNIVGAFTA
jgi:HPr kinase/phosphorylase